MILRTLPFGQVLYYAKTLILDIVGGKKWVRPLVKKVQAMSLAQGQRHEISRSFLAEFHV